MGVKKIKTNISGCQTDINKNKHGDNNYSLSLISYVFSIAVGFPLAFEDFLSM